MKLLDLARRRAGAVMLCALAIYTGILIAHASYAVGGADSSGYARLARSLVHGEVLVPIPELDMLGLPDNFAGLFAPLGYNVRLDGGELTNMAAPYYPIGFPLHIALSSLVLGWSLGPFVVSPIAAALCLVLLYRVGQRLGLSRTASLAAATLLAINPTFVFSASQPMSDVTALFWSLVMVWAGLRAKDDDRWFLLAGAAFGMAVLVRPTDVLLLAPLVFLLRPAPRPLVLFGLGGLPMAAIFFGFNYATYGDPLQTGYAAAQLHESITTSGIGVRFRHYVHGLAATMSPLVLAGWLGCVFERRVETRHRAMLVTWFGAFLAFYSCYAIYVEWWYTRFLLPAYPALLLGATISARSLSGLTLLRQRSTRLAVGTGLFLVAAAFALYHDRAYRVLDVGDGESIHALSCRLAAERVPERSLVVAGEMSGSLKFYTNHSIVRWENLSPGAWPVVRDRAAERGIEIRALLMEQELPEAVRRIGGEWHEEGRVRHVGLWSVRPTGEPPLSVSYGAGFSDKEYGEDGSSWRWMADEGTIVLENTGEPMQLVVSGTVPLQSLPAPPSLTILLNGRLVHEASPAPGDFRAELVVTAGDQGDGPTSELRIVTTEFFVPSELDRHSGDHRRLGFSLTSLEWRRLGTPR